MYRIIVASMIAYLVVTVHVWAQPCEWSALGDGASEPVFTMTSFDDGRGEALYIGGDFTTVGSIIARHVARWDGRSWEALGAGLESGLVFSLAVFDDGHGPALYAGGSFETSAGRPVRGIAKWDGASWVEVGGGIAGGASKPAVRALCVFDDGSGPALYAGGSFGSAGGEPGTSFIAKWDGESWSPVGDGVGSYVRSLAVFDDGSGASLYAAGYLQTAGGEPARHIAKWDGESWSPLDEGTDRYVNALAIFDDGSGPALYAGGTFTIAGGAPASYLAKWDGASWSEVGGGLNKSVFSLAAFDGGTGPALYVGGGFTMAGDTSASSVARWDGDKWSSLGAAFGGSPFPEVYALVGFADDFGPALYAGGVFLTAGGLPASHIARWRCDACYPDCDGSGALDFFDFLCFQNLFAAMDPGADCDGDTTFTFFDFLCFQNAFAAGCP